MKALSFLISATIAGMVAGPSPAPNSKPIDPATFARIAETDPLFQSFNVEMVEVTGGRFWSPYGAATNDRYAYRLPIDLENKRLRAAAKALAPAYIRVSGTWANSTYVPTPREVETTDVPTGFKQRLTRGQWRGLVNFSTSLNLPIIASMPVSAGTRNELGEWQTEQAHRLFALTSAYGGSIAAAEFINEPNLVKLGALPDGYDATAYSRDFKTFRAFVREAAPKTLILGPSSSGEGGELPASELMRQTGAMHDAISYHFYGALSQRCLEGDVSAADALGKAWLARTEKDHAFYSGLRDANAPGKPIWLTETAQAACGGSPWAAQWRDTFRYVDQLGRLAQRGVRVVAHNTLAASDYGLIDGDTFNPRPSYWAAVLWRRTMGRIVLQAPSSVSPDVRLYAHCLRDGKGGVAMLAINLSSTNAKLAARGKFSAYSMGAPSLDAVEITINRQIPRIGPNGEFPTIRSRAMKGVVKLRATSITFLEFWDAKNPACLAGRDLS